MKSGDSSVAPEILAAMTPEGRSLVRRALKDSPLTITVTSGVQAMTDDCSPWRAAGVNPPTPRKRVNMKREPVLTVAGVTALVAAIVALLVAFGLDLTNDQQNAILGVAAIAAPIIVGLLSRPRVTPVEPVARVRGNLGQTNLLYILLVVAAFLLVLWLFVRLA